MIIIKNKRKEHNSRNILETKVIKEYDLGIQTLILFEIVSNSVKDANSAPSTRALGNKGDMFPYSY